MLSANARRTTTPSGTSRSWSSDVSSYARGLAVRTIGSQPNFGRFCTKRSVRWMPLDPRSGGKW